MNKQKLYNVIYIAIVVILATCLLVGYTQQMGWCDLGEYAKFVTWISSPWALGIGLLFALICGKAYSDFNKLMSKKLLQYSVIGLGFGMTLQSAVASGSDGMLITIVSVFGTLALGWLIGRKLLGVDWQTSYLISSGTAICGGSAIAAVGPVIKAKSESMSVALGVVFMLNAIALFIFPPIGHAFNMSDVQFGTWAAIAIHDTSSVVGAGGAYSPAAQDIATTVKLTRALWIVIVALVTPFLCRKQLGEGATAGKPWYKIIPTFILWFVVAILFNTFVLSNQALGLGWGHTVSVAVSKLAKQMITLSLFFIGAGLTRETLKAVGLKPLLQGVLLWIVISCASLSFILLCM